MYVHQIFFNISPGLWGACTNSVNWGCDRTSFGQEILPPIMSGKVTSHAAIKYGRVNVRARIPRGDWIWPGVVVVVSMNTVNFYSIFILANHIQYTVLIIFGSHLDASQR